MDESEHVDWQKLARYLAGECPDEERRRLEGWIEADPARQELMQSLRRIWREAEQPREASPLDGLDVQADWEHVAGKIRRREARRAAAPSRPAARPATRPRSRRRGGFRRGAVVGIALLVVGAVLWLSYAGAGEPAASSYREVIAERGERANLQLADGTEITLNVESQLRIPETFGRGERNVYLQGEAYFDVASDSSRPFVVHSGEATVQVLGTVFDVKAYPGEEQVAVAVKEGAVSLRSAREHDAAPAAKLEPGQLGRLESRSRAGEGSRGRVVTEEVDLNTYLGWTEGRLVFEDASLPEVAAQLERWYDIECEVRDPRALAPLRLTAALKSTSLRGVLDVVATSLGIRYQIEEEGARVTLMRAEA